MNISQEIRKLLQRSGIDSLPFFKKQRPLPPGRHLVKLNDKILCAALTKYQGGNLTEFGNIAGYKGDQTGVSARRRLCTMARRGTLVVGGQKRDVDWLSQKFPEMNKKTGEKIDGRMICSALNIYHGHSLCEFARMIGYKSKNPSVPVKKRLLFMVRNGALTVGDQSRDAAWLMQKFPSCDWTDSSPPPVIEKINTR